MITKRSPWPQSIPGGFLVCMASTVKAPLTWRWRTLQMALCCLECEQMNDGRLPPASLLPGAPKILRHPITRASGGILNVWRAGLKRNGGSSPYLPLQPVPILLLCPRLSHELEACWGRTQKCHQRFSLRQHLNAAMSTHCFHTGWIYADADQHQAMLVLISVGLLVELDSNRAAYDCLTRRPQRIQKCWKKCYYYVLFFFI